MNARKVESHVLVFLMAVCMIHGCKTNTDSGTSALGDDAKPNACTLTDVTVPVLGPEEFQRSKGKPVTEFENFDVPLKGEVCVHVTNGLHGPPHGHRVSAAWLEIDGNLVIGPDPFSQVVEDIQTPYPVLPGEHQLSVRLASKPGSFLTVEIRLLPEDKEPPLVSIEPADGSTLETDLPLFRVNYNDEGVGVDISSLAISLNGKDVTSLFDVADSEAIWQVTIDDFLEEGAGELSVSIADRLGNRAAEHSSFLVQTPTQVLVADLSNDDPRYRHRSAYKLLYRPDEISQAISRKCLKQLNETPEPKTVDRLIEIIVSAEDHISRALAAGALGEAAGVDAATRSRDDVVDNLGYLLLGDESFAVKLAAARALGLTYNERGLPVLDFYIHNNGPLIPARPPDCDPQDPLPLDFECQKYNLAESTVGLQATKAAIRIAGQDHSVGNPGNMLEARAVFVGQIQRTLENLQDSGGQP